METKIVKFNQTELIALIDDAGTPHVAISPICEAIGLNLKSAKRSIQSHSILASEGTTQTLQVINDTQKREYFCLPLHLINGWLLNINANLVNTEAREKLIMYQRECYRVLFDYFFGNTREVIRKQKRRFDLSQELSTIGTELARLTDRKREIINLLRILDNEVYEQLDFFNTNKILTQ